MSTYTPTHLINSKAWANRPISTQHVSPKSKRKQAKAARRINRK